MPHAPSGRAAAAIRSIALALIVLAGRAPSPARVRRVLSAAAAAVLVTRKALTANALASSALPALNPNQPNQRSPAPITVIGKLCGCMGWCP